MKQYLESLELKDLKKIAKKLKLDDKVARIALISNIDAYIIKSNLDQATVEGFLVKKEKAPKNDGVSEVVNDGVNEAEEVIEEQEDVTEEPKEEEEEKSLIDTIEDKIEEVVEAIEEKVEEVIEMVEDSAPVEGLSKVATRWYKYLNYMKGKREWQEFISWFEVKYAKTFKFWDALAEIKTFLKLK